MRRTRIDARGAIAAGSPAARASAHSRARSGVNFGPLHSSPDAVWVTALGAAAVVLGAVTIWVFSDTLKIDGPLGLLKKIGWFFVAAVLLGFAVFFPVLVNSPSLEVSVGLNSMSSVFTVLVAALVQHTYLWLHSTPGAAKQTESMQMSNFGTTSTPLLFRETKF